MKKLLVNEIFGPTIQGEGPFAGHECGFVRLAICPLHCSWCDTSYTWAYTEALAKQHETGKLFDRESEVHPMSVRETLEAAILAAGNSRMIVISGGEPLAQEPPAAQKNPAYPGEDPLALLCYYLAESHIQVHIETAGIRKPSEMLHGFVTQYVVSPKLDNSGNALAKRYVPEVLDFFATSRKAAFKFVVTGPLDLDEIDQIVNAHHIRANRVWLMPEGTTSEAIHAKLPMVAEQALARGYNITSRMHVDIWGTERKH
jgi:7-carboxy-7-deazaguanine synthase